MSHVYNQLPVPMLPEQFIEEFIDLAAEAKPGDSIGLAAMQLAAQTTSEASIVFKLLSSIVDAKHRDVDARVIVDERYVRNMTRIGNRDYPNWLPLLHSSRRSERHQTRQRTDAWLDALHAEGVLFGRSPHTSRRGYVPLLRHAGSFHIAQKPFAAVHTKAAYFARAEGEVVSWINTGNLTDSDISRPGVGSETGMNNLSLRLSGKAATFVMKAVRGDFTAEAGVHVHGDKVMLIHDIGNSGEPARLPRILVEALEAIDPRRASVIIDPNDCEPRLPKAVVLLSQYAPNGLLCNALAYAAENSETYVYVPSQPDTDHRSKSFPYNLNNGLFKRRLERQAQVPGIVSVKREVPSHIKTQVVTYHDGTAKIIIGTDNFVTNLQKVVRNEEIAVVISLDFKNSEDALYFHRLANLLYEIGEIDLATLDKLTEDTNS